MFLIIILLQIIAIYTLVCVSLYLNYLNYSSNFIVISYNHARHWSSQPEAQTTEYHNIIKDTEKAIGN